MDVQGCVLGLDVGGTGMKGAVLDHGLRPLETVRRPTPRAEGPLAVVAATTDTLLTLNAMAAERALPVHHAGVVHASLATGLIGGPTGRLIREELRAAGTREAFLDVAGDSRRALAVVSRDDGDATVFNGRGPHVEPAE